VFRRKQQIGARLDGMKQASPAVEAGEAGSKLGVRPSILAIIRKYNLSHLWQTPFFSNTVLKSVDGWVGGQ